MPKENQKKDKPRSYEDFNYMSHMLFKTLGYDILATNATKWLYIILRGYFYLCIVCNFYAAFYVTLRFLQWERSESKLMRHALHFFYMFSAEVKFATFVKYRKRLRSLNNQLKDLYPTDAKQQEVYEVNRYYLSRTTRIVLSFYYSVMALMMVTPLLQSCITHFVVKRHFPYLRIFPTQLSFSSETPWGYAFAYFVDFTYSHLIVNFTLGTDLWMICASSQICMHFGYLAKVLASYTPHREREEEDCAFLSKFVKRHQLILDLHNEVDQIFGLLLASNLFTTASLLCCIAYYTVVEGFNMEGMSYMTVFFSVVGLFYLVSSHGQNVIDLSTSIAVAAYDQNWYQGSVRYRRLLMLIMAKAQRPSEISASSVVIISLDTLKTLMTITYRFFAVLRQIMGKN
ncbi:hypothetical protein KR059_007072 [Drosophila kikkawai]|nr:hypothetical protein KR059_007072 [Drosophila kikkawai]